MLPADFPNKRSAAAPPTTPAADLDALAEALCAGLDPSRLLVASDFDGTLAPIVTRPGEARALSASIMALGRLRRLGAAVAVISGRSQDALRRVIDVPGARLLGDYGLDSPSAEQVAALREFNASAAALSERLPGIVLEAKPGSTSLHFRADPAAGDDLLAGLAPLAERLGLRAGRGRMVVEVRPAEADKGIALARVIAELDPLAVAFAGDDEGDRSAFAEARSAERHLVVGVRSAEVPADLFDGCDAVIAGPEGWAAILEGLAERLDRS